MARRRFKDYMFLFNARRKGFSIVEKRKHLAVS
jgi:hypothetical protein